MSKYQHTSMYCYPGTDVLINLFDVQDEEKLKELEKVYTLFRLSELQLQKPDLVILDVILPGQSGFELCRELKANANTQKIPVVICSTKGSKADKLWGSMLGADAYIPKPVDQKQLMQTIQQLTSIY